MIAIQLGMGIVTRIQKDICLKLIVYRFCEDAFTIDDDVSRPWLGDSQPNFEVPIS